MEEVRSRENVSNTYTKMMEQISDDSVKTIESIMYEKVTKLLQMNFWHDKIKNGERLLLRPMRYTYVLLNLLSHTGIM